MSANGGHFLFRPQCVQLKKRKRLPTGQLSVLTVMPKLSSWQLSGFRVSTAYFSHDFSITINSLAAGKSEWHFRYLIFQIISVIDGWGISCEHALRWMPLDLTDDKSTLVKVMAWCRQATSHYLSQWWPRSLSSYGITRPQWVKIHPNYIFIQFLMNWWLGNHAHDRNSRLCNQLSLWCLVPWINNLPPAC